MSENKPIQLGLCCLNTILRAQNPSVFASRSCTMKTIREKGLKIAVDRARLNLDDIITMMHWNEKNGIKVFRLTSNIFAHFSNPKVERYSIQFATPKLKEIGRLSRLYKMRLTFHPGQYVVLGTPNENYLRNSLLDLKCHATILEVMDCPIDSVMVIHGGGTYGNKEETIKRWIKNYQASDPLIKKRLVLENCEKNFNIEDCLAISKECDVPVVFDTHHYECYKLLHPDEIFKEAAEYIPDILATWVRRGIKPKFHVSEQGSGRIGHHSDYIETIPAYLLEIPGKYGCEIDIMIEAKKKEQSIFRLYNKYPNLNCKINIPPKLPGLKIKIKIKKTACNRPKSTIKTNVKTKLKIKKTACNRPKSAIKTNVKTKIKIRIKVKKPVNDNR
jgi:UV DNA damage endonuclease